ncbi:MAG: putative membrane protein, partial [Spirosomataceae bacterium]
MKFSTFSFAENKRLTSALLILLLFVAACLRFYKIGDHGLAGDEKYSMYVSQFVVIEGGKEPNSIRNARYFTPEQFWDDVKPYHFFESIARLDTGNGAFYTLSLRLWMNVFGKSDAAARSLSAVFNLATILLLFYFVRDFFKNTSLALLVTFLSVISP